MIKGRAPRLVVFGDSHYAAIRQAGAEGLFDATGIDLEYWGHVGRRFNYLSFRDGAIVPVDDFTAQRFAKFNEKGRRHLPAADFDLALFMGVRVILFPAFATLARNAALGQRISSGLRHRILRDQLAWSASYGFAKGFVKAGTPVVLVPIAFPTTGCPINTLTPAEADAADALRPGIWADLTAMAAQDGITLLAQPESTVTGGLFTRAEYGVPDIAVSGDHHHKNAAWGALAMNRTLDLLRGGDLLDASGADQLRR